MSTDEVLRLDLAGGRLVVDFESDADLEARIAKGESVGWVFRLAQRLREGQGLKVVLNGKTRALELETRVSQIFRSGQDLHGTMLQVLASETVPIEPRDSPAQPARELPGDAVEDAESGQGSGETLGVSAMFDIKRLDPPAKVRLASKASRPQRQILLRDSSAQVAMALLNNPQLEAKEVLELVRNPQSASGVLQRIGQDRRWAGNYEIQLALVKNPRTPSPLAIRFVDQLRMGDLRDLAKSQALRENIRKAVLRLYLKR